MFKRSKVTDQTAEGQGGAEGQPPKKKGIKRKSKVPGVMITQYVEELPEGKTTPDFTRKPIALTIQEGKLAIFKAKVIGEPQPTVTWRRANGEMDDPEKFMVKYDPTTNEHTLEISKVSGDEADTYKCFASNEFGKAVCTVVLNVIEVGFKKKKEMEKSVEVTDDPTEFRKKLKKGVVKKDVEKKVGEIDQAVWDILLSAEKKDYERICIEYGITDFRGMLKRLTEMKKEREEEQAKFIQHLCNLRHIDIRTEDLATFELDMELKDPNSRIFLYKDGEMIPFTKDVEQEMKHSLKQIGKKYVFAIKHLTPEDAGLYQVDVEGVNIFSTDFKIPPVEFAVKLQEIKAMEREDALFECVLSQPLNQLAWTLKNSPISNSEKYEITVSEDKLIHRLKIIDCMPLDAGIYAAIAGIKSSSAWLLVEPDKDAASKGKKPARKTTLAGGGGDLSKIAAEQQEKLKRDVEAAMEAAKKSQADREAAEAAARAKEAEDAAAQAKAEKEAMEAAAAAAEAAAKAANEAALAEAKAKGMSDAQAKAAAEAAAAKAKAKAEEEARRAKEARDKEAAKAKAAAAKAAKGGAAGAAGAAGVGGGAGGAGGVGGAGGAGGAGGVGGVGGAGGAGGVGGVGGAGGAGGADGAFGEGGIHGAGGAGGAGGAFGAGGAGGAFGAGGAGLDGAGGAGGGGEGGADGDGSEDSERAARRRARAGDLVPDTKIGQSSNAGADPNEQSEVRDGKSKVRTRQGLLVPETVIGGDNDDVAAGLTEAAMEGSTEGGGKRSSRTRQGPLLPETVIDPGVHFTAGLEDRKAIVGESAELECKLSSADCKGVWYKDGAEITSTEGITISQDGATHKLKIHKVTEEYSGMYRFEADGRKTEAMISAEDPPRFNAKELEVFAAPVVVKTGHKASFKIPYIGKEPVKVQWYKEGEELKPDANVRIDNSDGYGHLVLNKLLRKDTGEIKIKVKNEFGIVEAFANLVVLDKPTPPLGPLEILEASANAIEIKWRAPKDDGGSPVTNYHMERQQIGRNTWKKIGLIAKEAYYKDTDVDHGRRYCYRLRAISAEGTSDQMETEDVQAGTKAYPGPPSAPKVVSATKDCITLSWSPPSNTGGSNIVGYNLEKRKKGSNLWSLVNPADEPIKEKTFGVKDVIGGLEYEFRAMAINFSGAGEPSSPSEFVIARDPKKVPGQVIDLKVTDSTYTTLSLSWTKPKEEKGVQDEAKGYFVEIRPAESTEWNRCNTSAIIQNTFTVKGMKSMAMYWVRVIAINEGGQGAPQELNNYVLAMPPPVRPRFTDAKIKSFMVVRAGNSARVTMNFEASPWPDVTWLKDGVPVSKRATISNAEGNSQLLIPSAEWSDTGVYTIVVKNIVGQETYSIEIRVTDEPKPPGPVEVDENVPGTVTISWTASPDEKRDDRLHYMVTKRDSVKRAWHTVADRIFNNKFTLCNIMPGREYWFRVYAKNDMGQSLPSESPKWLIVAKKAKFVMSMPETKTCNLERPPKFLVPLKMHSAPQGYECYMSCAVKGDPTPHITWYRDNVNLNTNTNYLISNTCGVCSMLILRVGPNDTGEYMVVAENPLGRAECSTKLAVRE